MQQQNEWINILLKAQQNQNNPSKPATPPADSPQATTQAETAEDLDAAAFSNSASTNINPNIATTQL